MGAGGQAYTGQNLVVGQVVPHVGDFFGLQLVGQYELLQGLFLVARTKPNILHPSGLKPLFHGFRGAPGDDGHAVTQAYRELSGISIFGMKRANGVLARQDQDLSVGHDPIDVKHEGGNLGEFGLVIHELEESKRAILSLSAS